ncbi:MAG: polysaccharide deacetylase [Christensenellaceae bacterium]|jgi:peptidoglycan/xylan/chitin deacetylase (PgdA/CDA1 family)|nr:polysaccharide deacetylase [Christensenellaceae bacterium]
MAWRWIRFFALLTSLILLSSCGKPIRSVPIFVEPPLPVANAAEPTDSPEPTPGETPEPTPEPSPEPTETPAEYLQPPLPIAYLSFDDGPSRNTDGVLDILKEEGVTATFFVIGENAARNAAGLQRMVEQGCVVANHSNTHDMPRIYKSQEALFADIQACTDTLHSILGEDYPVNLFRFPGGSTGKLCREYRQAVAAAGYRYFDWNALNGDAETRSPRTPEELLARLKSTVQEVHGRKDRIIILMHDTGSKTNTVLMLRDAIRYLKDLGYSFDTLDHYPTSAAPTLAPSATPEPTPDSGALPSQEPLVQVPEEN